MSTLSSSSSSTTTTMKASNDEVNDDFMMRFANSLQPTTTTTTMTNAETRNRIDDEESGKRAESAPDVVDATAKLAISSNSNPTQVTEVSQFNYYVLANMSYLNMMDVYYIIYTFLSLVITIESVYLKSRIN